MTNVEFIDEAPAGQLVYEGQGLYEKIRNEKVAYVKVSLDGFSELLRAAWRFDKYKTRREGLPKLETVVVVTKEPAPFLERNKVLDGVHYAKELTSEPPNCLYPMAYAKKMQELEALGIEVEVLDDAALSRLGMRALLAVGQASVNPPAVVILTWKGSWKGSPKVEKPIVLVGKGVNFDSGGICIKPPKQQHEMKWDKAAACTVAGTLKALALTNSPAYVVGILGLVENMPDGKALKPGDVIVSKSGQTIEIIDTDAEGRLVLADCLSYAEERYSPEVMIDLGTLTQETFASLGAGYAALYSNDKMLIKQLLEAGEASGDLLWHMPMGSYFAKQIESHVADVKNLGEEYNGENGAAAEFLKRFVKTPYWAHIDISGVAWTKEVPTGYGVSLLLEFIAAKCGGMSL